MTPDVYDRREQTKAKHFILKLYLQELSFKVLHQWDMAYIDGFSGPWESQTENFSDTSFMIAINVLKDAQARIEESTGLRRTIRCFFSENNKTSFNQLSAAVAPHHVPGHFEIYTHFGNFDDSTGLIRKIIGNAFPLIFIDPTGWTGYAFEKIKPIFDYDRCEVIINFMFDFINRFSASSDSSIVSSLDDILGGPGWRDRIDQSMPTGLAVEKLFRETLKKSGNFAHVVSTKIEKSTANRPHFFITYATKRREGLKAFRNTEYNALKLHARDRAIAKDRERQKSTGMGNLFADHDASQHESNVDDIIKIEFQNAVIFVKEFMRTYPKVPFHIIADMIMEKFILRETDAKDICLELQQQGFIENSWGRKPNKPKEDTIISASRATQ